MAEDEIPYEWPAVPTTTEENLQLWNEVSVGLDKNQTGELVVLRLAYTGRSRFCFRAGFCFDRSKATATDLGFVLERRPETNQAALFAATLYFHLFSLRKICFSPPLSFALSISSPFKIDRRLAKLTLLSKPCILFSAHGLFSSAPGLLLLLPLTSI
jgi:hypothetical protein